MNTLKHGLPALLYHCCTVNEPLNHAGKGTLCCGSTQDTFQRREEGERKCTGSGSGVLIYSRASRRPAFDAVFEPPSNTENSTGEMPPQTYHSIRIPSLSHLATYCTTGCSHPINFTLPNRYASLSLVRKGQPEITIKLNMRGSGRHLQPAAFLLHHSH